MENIKSMVSLLEVACFNLKSAQDAISAGAQRIEWCSDRNAGGLTPEDPHDVRRLRELQGPHGCIPVNVMIRSNGGLAFTASEAEVLRMEAAINAFKPYASGFVFGILKADGMIDSETCRRLIEIASPLQCTFHRAFDYAQHELSEKFNLIRQCGFASILSSGGPHDAILGQAALKQLVEIAEETNVQVIVGGGVRSGNIQELGKATGAYVFHTAATSAAGDIVNIEEIERIREAMANLFSSNISAS